MTSLSIATLAFLAGLAMAHAISTATAHDPCGTIGPLERPYVVLPRQDFPNIQPRICHTQNDVTICQ